MPKATTSATHMQPAAASPQHWPYVDALRGIAILAVLAFHLGYAAQGLPTFLGDVLGRGYAGVQLFFVLSSFTLAASLTARSGDRGALSAYFLRRLFRIAPLFWFAMALRIYLAGGADGGWGLPEGGDMFHTVLTALLLHGFDPNTINGIVPGGWSVGIEMQFYLVLPLLLAVSTTLRRALAVWFVCVAISVAGQPLIEHAVGLLYPASRQGLVHEFAFYALPTQLPVFASGLVLFRLMGPDRAVLRRIEARLPADRRLRAATILAFVLVIGLPVNLASPVPSLVRTFPGHIGYGVLAAMLVYAFATYPKSDTLAHRALQFIGRISYSAYLLHFFILDAVVAAMPESVTSQPLLDLVALTVIVVPLTLLAASLSHMLIETPGIALGRRVIALVVARRAPALIEPPGEVLLGQGAN